LSKATNLLEGERKEKKGPERPTGSLKQQWMNSKKLRSILRIPCWRARNFPGNEKNSEAEAGQILEKARAEAEKLRQETCRNWLVTRKRSND